MLEKREMGGVGRKSAKCRIPHGHMERMRCHTNHFATADAHLIQETRHARMRHTSEPRQAQSHQNGNRERPHENQTF